MPPPLYDPAEEEGNELTDALAPGTVLNDCYRVQDVLGKGGFGITYLAEKLNPEADAEPGAGQGHYVIKENLCPLTARRDVNGLDVICYTNNALFDWSLKNFIKEAQIQAQLQHQNIVPVLEAFERNGTAYIVMPFIQGDDLTRHAPQRDKEGAAWLESLLPPLLSALEYLHGEGVIHLDIKPDNILLTEDGEPVLIDFGAASMMNFQKNQTIVGTLGFAPPEQLQQYEIPQPSFDIYALGATFYYMVTGQLPANSQVRQERADNKTSDPLPPLARQKRYLYFYSHSFLAGIDRALSLRSTDRWQSAADWLEYLSSRPEPAPSRLLRWAFYTALGAASVVAAGFFLSDMVSERAAAEQAAREAAESLAAEQAAREAAESLAAEQAAREAAERLAAEQAAREAAERLAAEQAAREAAERLAAEQAAREAAEKLAAEQAAREAAERLAAEQAAREAAERLAAEQAAREAAERQAAEQAAREAAERAAAEQTAREKLVRETAARLEERGVEEGKYTEALLEKAGQGDAATVELLLAVGTDVNYTSESGETPLYMAARNGHTELVQMLLAVPGINVEDACRKKGWTRLQLAAAAGLTDFFKEQLELGASAGWKDHDWDAALCLACENGHEEIVRQLLLDTGRVNVNHTQDGYTALYRAAEGGHLGVVRMLLDVPGIQIYLPKKNLKLSDPWKEGYENISFPVLERGDVTPLEIALFEKHPEVAMLLLSNPLYRKDLTLPIVWDALRLAVQRGNTHVVRRLLVVSRINNQQLESFQGGNPLLLQAVTQGNPAIVRELLKIPGIRCNQSAVHAPECTPLYYAALRGYTDIARLLLSQPDIDVELACKPMNWTRLHLAAAAGLTEQIDGLLRTGYDVCKEDLMQKTPLCLAAAAGHVEVLRKLLAVPVSRSNLTVPLFAAVEAGHVKVVRLLIEEVPGVNINSVNSRGDTVLHASLICRRREVTKLLLRFRGIHVNQRNASGSTPLHLAVMNRDLEVVKLLLDFPGIKLRLKDDAGYTPLRLAEKLHQKKCAELIRKAIKRNR